MQAAIRGALPVLALAFFGSDVSSAQDEVPESLTPRPRAPQEEDLHAELEELVREIEVKLTRIDLELADAGAGEVPAGEIESSGLSDLLRSAREKSQWVVGAIDRIFEIRDHHSGGT